MSKILTYHLHTDGACSNNHDTKLKSIGGWAYLIKSDCSDQTLMTCSGRLKNTTNNRMEMLAIIKGLQQLPDKAVVNIHTDSDLIVKTITQKWKRNKNIDLWHLLDTEIHKKNTVNFIKVKGHSGNIENEIVDKLAVERTKENEH